MTSHLDSLNWKRQERAVLFFTFTNSFARTLLSSAARHLLMAGVFGGMAFVEVGGTETGF